MKLRIALAALALLAASSPAALAAGDVEKGKAVFKRCQVCHVHDTKTNKVGPHLGDVIGRKAGSVEGFHYSDAMKKKGEEGLVWTEENIATYLKDPKAFVPGNKMVFVGLKKDDEIADVIAFLKSPPEQ
jgi:cytochrome c